jgi:hypothetical protein
MIDVVMYQVLSLYAFVNGAKQPISSGWSTMQRHTERTDVVLLTELLESEWIVTIQKKNTINAFRTIFSMLIKELQPLKTCFYYYLAIAAWEDCLVLRKVLFEPCRKTVLSCEDYEWRDRPALKVDSLNHGDPSTVSWLYHFWLITAFRACDSNSSSNNTYLEACFIARWRRPHLGSCTLSLYYVLDQTTAWWYLDPQI